MSLGDELRILRAMAGGPTPLDIAAEAGIDSGLYCQLEQRYRDVADDEILTALAEYFGCDASVLIDSRTKTRKDLSQFLANAQTNKQEIELCLRVGDRLHGTIAWWDLGAIGIGSSDGGGHFIVQRHAVVDWK